MLRGRPRNGMDLEKAMEAYLAACQIAGNVASWLDMQERIITAFSTFHGETLLVLEDAAPHHLTTFLAWCQRERRNSSATLRRKATVLRAWARWCRKSGLVPMCALADADMPPERPRPIEVASHATYLAAIEKHQPPYSDECRVLLGSGLRRGELLHLRWEDIDLEQGLVYVRRRASWSPKSRKDRVVGLTQDAREALHRLCEKHRKPKHLGPFLDERGRTIYCPSTLTHAWRAFTRANALPTRVHALRHAHATAAVEHGAVITDVQAQLGHANISTTMRYVKLNPAAPLRLVSALDGPQKDAAPKEGGRPAKTEKVDVGHSA